MVVDCPQVPRILDVRVAKFLQKSSLVVQVREQWLHDDEPTITHFQKDGVVVVREK